MIGAINYAKAHAGMPALPGAILDPAVHDGLFALLHWAGLRDRLTCPRCERVGTWKIHGGVFGDGNRAAVRRWLCKWCGLYLGPEGVLAAGIDDELRHWTLEDVPEKWTPAKELDGRANPWFG